MTSVPCEPTAGVLDCPPHCHFTDQERGLRVSHRDTLPVFPAGPDTESEIRTDHHDALQDIRTVPRKSGTSHRLAHRAVPDQISFRDFEHELSGHGIHLPAPHLPDEKSVLNRLDYLFWQSSPRSYQRIGHPDNRPRVIGLPATVAGGSNTILHRS